MFFKDLFYFIYSHLSKIKAARTPALSASAYVSVLIGVNIITIVEIVLYYYNINVVRDFNVNTAYEGIILGGIILVINHFTIYSKRQAIFDSFESKKRKISKIKSFIFILYIILTFVIFFVVVANFSVPLE